MIRLLSICTMLAALTTLAPAQSSDRVQFGRDIFVAANEKVGDVVCIACSIHLRGEAAGSAVAIAGSVTVDDNAELGQDAVTVAGSVRLIGNAQVHGGVTVVGGSFRRDPRSTVAGDVAALEGALWLILGLLVPIAIFGGLIAVIVWLIQRNRRAAPVPA